METHLKLSNNYFKPVECGLNIQYVYDYTSNPKYVTCKRCLKLIQDRKKQDPERQEIEEIINSEYQLRFL